MVIMAASTDAGFLYLSLCVCMYVYVAPSRTRRRAGTRCAVEHEPRMCSHGRACRARSHMRETARGCRLVVGTQGGKRHNSQVIHHHEYRTLFSVISSQ